MCGWKIKQIFNKLKNNWKSKDKNMKEIEKKNDYNYLTI